MRKSIFIPVFYFCLAIVVTAVLPVTITAQSSKSTLKFDEVIRDFGLINEVDGPVSHEFTFINSGSNAIVLENVSVSCGCTHPDYSKAPVLPGKRGSIKITYDPKDRPGIFARDIHITSNGGKNRDVITVKGEVKPRPRSIEEDFPYSLLHGIRLSNLSANMRFVAQGETKSIVVSVINSGSADVTLDFDVEPNDRAIKISAPRMLKKGERADITITSAFAKGGPYGRMSYRVIPVINGTKSKLAISATAIVTDNFDGVTHENGPQSVFTPNYYHFGKVKQGEKVSHKINIANSGKKPLNIRLVQTKQHSGISLKAGTVIQPGKSIDVTITMDTSKAPTGLLTETITIITDDPARPYRELRVAADILGR